MRANAKVQIIAASFAWAWNDVSQRYQRRALGPLWETLGIAALILGITYVSTSLFILHFWAELPYIGLGFIAWSAISRLITDSTTCVLHYEKYGKHALPEIYIGHLIARNCITTAHYLVLYGICVAMLPIPLSPAMLLAPVGFLFLYLNAIWLMPLLGMMCAHIRGLGPFIRSLLPIVFFITPITWHETLLTEDRLFLVRGNPFFYAVEVIRAPLLGQMLPLALYIILMVTTLLGYAALLLVGDKTGGLVHVRKNDDKHKPLLRAAFSPHAVRRYLRIALARLFWRTKQHIKKHPLLLRLCLHTRKRMRPHAARLRRVLSFKKSPFIRESVITSEYLTTLYQEAVLLCIKHRVPKWWELSQIYHCNSVPVLRQFLREYVLRNGDWRSFLSLTNRLNMLAEEDKEERFSRMLMEWFARSLEKIHIDATPLSIMHGEKPPCVLALSAWGNAHTDMFLSYCLPTLMAEGNMDALCAERHPVLLIHTNAKGKAKISKSTSIRTLQSWGATIVYAMIDTNIIHMAHSSDDVQWLTGAAQSLSLAYAKKLGADFHHLMPDHLYASGYFAQLLKLALHGHKAVVQGTFHAAAEPMASATLPYRQGETLSIEAADLTAIGLNHLHPLFALLLMHGNHAEQGLPALHILLWESKEELHIASPHLSLAYLDRTIMAGIPERFFFSLSSELNHIIPPECPIYCPKAADKLLHIGLSADYAPAISRNTLLSEYYTMFWRNVETREHLRFFDEDTVFPINRQLRASDAYASDADIHNTKKALRQGVQCHIPSIRAEQAMYGLLMLQKAEVHPAAQAAFALLRENAEEIWQHCKENIDAQTPGGQTQHIARMLWHYDLMPEAIECLRLQSPISDLARFMFQCMKAVKENERWGQNIRAASARNAEISVVGVTIWGAAYMQFFLDYHLPCLLADGNVPYLAQRGKTIFSIATDAEGKHLIMGSDAFRKLSAFLEFRFTQFEEAPSRKTPELKAQFYQRYGMLDHHHVALARALGADLFLMPPDCVFSDAGFFTFKHYLDEGYNCCAIACVEADKDIVLPALEEVRDNKRRLSLDSGYLLDLALTNKTDYFRSIIFDPRNRPNAYPREFFWRVPGGYSCHSIFMHPMATSARALSRPMHPNHENVDWALIPRVLQADGKMKIIENARELAIMHCSDKDVRANEFGPHRYKTTAEMMEYFLSVNAHNYPVHRECFKTAQFFPCADEEYPVSKHYFTDVAFIQGIFSAMAAQAKTDIFESSVLQEVQRAAVDTSRESTAQEASASRRTNIINLV